MARGTKTTEFLKECMSDALIKLMQEKNFSKITVNDITTVAGVGRSTWFRNFVTKSDALTFKLVRLWERWAKEHNLSDHQRFNLDNARDFFRFNYGIRDLLKTIYNAEIQSCIYDAFCVVIVSCYPCIYQHIPRQQTRYPLLLQGRFGRKHFVYILCR